MRVGFDHGEERSIGKLRLCYLRSFWKTCTSPTNDTIPATVLAWMIARGTRSSSWSATRPRRSAIFYFDDRPNPTIDHQQAIARRGAADGGELRQAAGAAARVAADKRGVTRSQPQIHDSPRNQLNSRSIGDGEARSSRQRE